MPHTTREHCAPYLPQPLCFGIEGTGNQESENDLYQSCVASFRVFSSLRYVITAILNKILSQFFSSVGAWRMRPALSIDWHTLLEGDLVAHFVVLPNYQEDETMHRETLENLDRCPETKKHKDVVLTMVGLEGPNTQDKAKRFMAATGHIATCHPAGVAGKAAGKFIQYPAGLPSALEEKWRRTSPWEPQQSVHHCRRG